MVGNHYALYLIKRWFSPTDLAMLHPTHAADGTGVLYLQQEIAA